MSLLEQIGGPADLKAVPADQIGDLAQEIRDFLVNAVSRTGGHLGPNLGVVELTIALHRVFDSPRDAIIFDTGHQSYVHKILTGRQDFSALRSRGGLSGYPSRAESPHDVVENSHASTSLSWAHGIAKGRAIAGHRRHTVAVIGDGALTGGMAWEALNNIAADKSLPLVLVVNDNERSYAPTIGGLAEHLSTLRTTQGYEQFLDWGKHTLRRAPVVGGAMERALHGVKKGIKDVVAPQGLFEDLGLKYIGPIDGHDSAALEAALRRAKAFGGPVLVHVLTQKGRGYEPARQDEADQFHAVGVINPETGLPFEIAGRSWTDEFSDAMVEIGAERRDVVGVTAAMLIPVGLGAFAKAYPDRIIDVGIAEQHAVTMASGMAFAGLHPVVAVYATFLNRAFDQLLMDAALHQAGVTIVLDRAGITGPDGASHHGMWDMSICGVIPGLRLNAPRDGQSVARALREAVDVADGPTVIRFPKGSVAAPIEAVRSIGPLDVVADHTDGAEADMLIVAVGSMVATAITVAGKLAAEGQKVMVVDPRWVVPVAPELVDLARGVGRIAVIEDNVAVGGVGEQVVAALRADGNPATTSVFAIPREFLHHATRGQVLDQIGLTPDAIAAALAR
ncbi:MAG: 1-deoxy-D-xylulose-5-phosphate synthase [Tetrasphaera jenkinsii]|uniref:1-deoxy-D-xylulose-5-phosphate synthase n=1 Tax=Nostocoides jenkinsii Ben 74 TaxID=1193518 RepID=A0A077M5S7_9MICO|nr:1-deoxy-D-xylulose-5-phosphate synthase [Tetrasphaera jenkinsii]MCI1261416.1 1-deoxy-D-xylulose-5-phosphate synthase [Tetrasphaera jenkinsii]CCI51889.1 1-deoxy-D-xylulose-5-phosphate synthase 2 [Tetrasphaera jenkinsii Ben 74]